jgi:DNA primase large subunit
MQTLTVRFTKNDLAKYPFLKEAAEHVKTLEIKIEDLASPEYSKILERAEERVEEAILYAMVTRKIQNEEVEILSFPTAIVLAAATENSFIKRRYALAEAKQAYNEMKLEAKEKILEIAKNFQWKIETANAEEKPYDFKLHFSYYLKNTSNLKDKNWKLVNRPLRKGKVYLTKNETARLLSEEVRRHIEKRLEVKGLQLPQKLLIKAEKLRKLTVGKISETEMEEIPKTVIKEAFPPCINALYKAAASGRHISHIGRFTLTAFLINIGMPTENVIDLFKNSSDFNERLTRYQVEHIAGERGSRIRYTPPRCETLKTHGVCQDPDQLCKRISHPINYYKQKQAEKALTPSPQKLTLPN